MPGIIVGTVLIASLLLVHFSVRSRPMPVAFPLDVDDGLPLPEAGQASTVFSLSALFGAYLGIYLVLGLPALGGLAVGTALGLLLLKSWIDASESRTFEQFLEWVLRGNDRAAAVLAMAIFASQCAYAASELLILREVARIALGIRADHATLLAVGVGIIGYFYILLGGYTAVFRTDIVQFVLVGGMACALAVSSLVRGLPAHWNIVLLPRQGYWEAQALGTSLALYGYQFVVGMIIGAGFLAVCPDAWKRVFIVTRKRRKARMRFLVFSAAGVLPFLLIPAVSLTGQRIPDGAVNVGLMFSGLLTSDPMLVCATLALVGSFLSAFNSAVLAAVHTGLIFRRVSASTEDETPRFHWLMVSALLCTAFLFLALVSAGNPYLLSNLLMGLFAIIAGIQIGAWGAGSRLPGNSMLWMIVVGCVGWFVYVISVVGVPTAPSTYQINTVPGGAALVAVSGIIAHWLYRKGRNSVRL